MFCRIISERRGAGRRCRSSAGLIQLSLKRGRGTAAIWCNSAFVSCVGDTWPSVLTAEGAGLRLSAHGGKDFGETLSTGSGLRWYCEETNSLSSYRV